MAIDVTLRASIAGTYYAVLRPQSGASAGKVWNTNSLAYENWTDGNVANYNVAGTRQGTSLEYVFTLPGGADQFNPHDCDVYLQAGGSANPLSDTYAGTGTLGGHEQGGAFPNVASGSTGALPTTGTGANQIALSSGAIALGSADESTLNAAATATALATAAAAIKAKTDLIGTNAEDSPNTVTEQGTIATDVNATISSRSTYAGGAADADAAAIKAKTDLIGTNAEDSPNTVTEQGTIATDVNATISSRSTYAGGAADADAAAIKAKTDLIGTNAEDSPNTVTEQGTIATDVNATISSRSTYSGGAADADAAAILADAAAIETQTNKIATNAGDSPNAVTAQGNAATAATQATSAASSSAAAATSSAAAASSAASAASSAATAASQATTAATTIGALATLLDAMISGGSFTSDALKNAPAGGGGGSLTITPLQAVVAGGAILGEELTAYVGATMPPLEFDLLDQLGNPYHAIGPIKFRLFTINVDNPGSETVVDTLTATLSNSNSTAVMQVPAADHTAAQILGWCLYDAGVASGAGKMPVKLGHYRILPDAGPLT